MPPDGRPGRNRAQQRERRNRALFQNLSGGGAGVAERARAVNVPPYCPSSRDGFRRVTLQKRKNKEGSESQAEHDAQGKPAGANSRAVASSRIGRQLDAAIGAMRGEARAALRLRAGAGLESMHGRRTKCTPSTEALPPSLERQIASASAAPSIDQPPSIPL